MSTNSPLDEVVAERNRLARLLEDIDDALNDSPSEYAERLAWRVFEVKQARDLAQAELWHAYARIARMKAALCEVLNTGSHLPYRLRNELVELLREETTE